MRRDILDEHNAFLDRETLLHTANGTLPCVLSFAPLDMGKGGVLALRESRRLCGFAARTIGAGAVYALDDIPGDSPAIAPSTGGDPAAPRGMTLRSCSRARKGRSGTTSLRPSTTRDAAGRPPSSLCTAEASAQPYAQRTVWIRW